MSTVSVAEGRQLPIPQPCATLAPVVSTLSPQADRVAFLGNSGSYWRLMAWGTLLQAVTLGLYRFWLFTDMRRQLWSHTVIDGESLEYTGTPVELLLGFLIAIGILIPIYAAIFVGTLELGIISRFSSLLGLTVFAMFGKYATYRARRYRLTRTVLRGVRFNQTGSGLLYAIRATLWSTANIATLGLTYPWAVANLERYKMRHTFYGDVAGKFVGTGRRLFLRGILIWILIVAPIVGGFLSAVGTLDWPAIAHALSLGKGPAILGALLKTRNFDLGVSLGLGGIVLSIFFLVVLYPAFQAIVMRWWLAGLQLGGASAASDLRIRRYYGAYARYAVCLVGLAFVVLFAIGIIAATAKALGFESIGDGHSGAGMALGLAAYASFLLPAWTVYQVVVTFRLWQVAAQSMTVRGLETLENVQASEASATAVGEGLADALLGAAAI
jgi:uncharacterized membrane protein YjgN (DUF898 family)